MLVFIWHILFNHNHIDIMLKVAPTLTLYLKFNKVSHTISVRWCFYPWSRCRESRSDHNHNVPYLWDSVSASFSSWKWIVNAGTTNWSLSSSMRTHAWTTSRTSVSMASHTRHAASTDLSWHCFLRDTDRRTSTQCARPALIFRRSWAWWQVLATYLVLLLLLLLQFPAVCLPRWKWWYRGC